MKFEITSLADLADYFDHIANLELTGQTVWPKRAARHRASAWEDAARIVRDTRIVKGKKARIEDL